MKALNFRHPEILNPEFKVQNKGEIAEITLYDEIGAWGITASDMRGALKQAGNSEHIDIYLNSPGGDVFDGIAMYNDIRQHKATVTVHVQGLAASAASVLAMAADNIVMGEGSFMMVHNAWTLALGDANTLRETANTLEGIDNQLVSIYARRTGLPEDKIKAMLDAETWLGGDDAVEQGFANSHQSVPVKKAACDLSIYAKVPAILKRETETLLRDVGYSPREAKAAISEGFGVLKRDVERTCESERDAANTAKAVADTAAFIKDLIRGT